MASIEKMQSKVESLAKEILSREEAAASARAAREAIDPVTEKRAYQAAKERHADAVDALEYSRRAHANAVAEHAEGQRTWHTERLVDAEKRAGEGFTDAAASPHVKRILALRAELVRERDALFAISNAQEAAAGEAAQHAEALGVQTSARRRDVHAIVGRLIDPELNRIRTEHVLALSRLVL